MKETKRVYFCMNCGDVEIERPDGDWMTKPRCIVCDIVMDRVPDLLYDPLDFTYPKDAEKTPREDRMERRTELRCSHCPLRRGENTKRSAPHGKGKRRGQKGREK